MNISKTELSGALSALGKLICRTSPLAEYKSLQIETTQNALFLRTASLNETLEYQILTAVDQKFDLCVNFDEFRDAVRNCRSKNVQLEFQQENNTLLTGERQLQVSQIKLPVIERAETCDSVIFKDGFLDLLKRMAPVVDTHNARKIMHGINVSKEGLTVTNGRELLHIPMELALMPQLTIPLPFGLFMTKETSAGVLEWWQNTGVTYIRISVGNWTWITNALQGDYPDWHKVIPDDSSLYNSIQYSPETCEVLLQWCKNIPDSRDDVTAVSVSSREKDMIHLEVNDMELDVSAELNGDWNTLVIHLNKMSFQRLLSLGHTTLRFHDCYSPLTADGGTGRYITMPIRKIERTQQIQTTETDKEKENMNQQVTEPVQEAEECVSNPMDELMNVIESCRLKLKAVTEEATLLSRKVREVQLAQKQKERDFIQARRAIERIRMAI